MPNIPRHRRIGPRKTVGHPSRNLLDALLDTLLDTLIDTLLNTLLKTLLDTLLGEAQSGLRNPSEVAQIATRLPFEIDGKIAGTVLDPDARYLAAQVPGLNLDESCLSVSPFCAKDSAPVLQQIALALRNAGRLPVWRDELLAVLADDGSHLGVIERAAMRPLGLRTCATHLIGLRNDGHVWLQQRAFTKDTDPGLWDTLAGGLVGTGLEGGLRRQENLRLATQREAYEEAGVAAELLTHMRALPNFRINRLVTQGHMIEDVYAFSALMPDSYLPKNNDGEVAGFAHFSHHEVISMIEQRKLALEPSIVLLQLFLQSAS